MGGGGKQSGPSGGSLDTPSALHHTRGPRFYLQTTLRVTFHKLLNLESEEHLHVGEGYWEELQGLPSWKRAGLTTSHLENKKPPVVL